MELENKNLSTNLLPFLRYEKEEAHLLNTLCVVSGPKEVIKSYQEAGLQLRGLQKAEEMGVSTGCWGRDTPKRST